VVILPAGRETAEPTPGAIFRAFVGIAITSFGGALPWARRSLVERRRWLSPNEFTHTVSLCQFLPGAPVLNLAVVLGSRWQGARGAVVAVIGFVGLPVLLSLSVGTIYLSGNNIPALRGALAGIAAAAAGMTLSMAIKIAAPMIGRRRARESSVIVAAFVAIALLSAPLAWVVLVLAPISVILAWRAR
jgi:chromate transporter